MLLLAAACAQTAPDTAAAKQQLLWQKLESTINEVDRSLDGVLGVAVLDLEDRQEIPSASDEVFPQASSIKIAVLAELYRQAQTAS